MFLKKSCRKWGSKTISRPLFVFLKNPMWGKSKRPAAEFQYNLIALNLGYRKSKLCKTLYYAFRDMIKFEFLEKSPGRVSPLHFVYDF